MRNYKPKIPQNKWPHAIEDQICRLQTLAKGECAWREYLKIPLDKAWSGVQNIQEARGQRPLDAEAKFAGCPTTSTAQSIRASSAGAVCCPYIAISEGGKLHLFETLDWRKRKVIRPKCMDLLISLMLFKILPSPAARAAQIAQESRTDLFT